MFRTNSANGLLKIKMRINSTRASIYIVTRYLFSSFLLNHLKFYNFFTFRVLLILLRIYLCTAWLSKLLVTNMHLHSKNFLLVCSIEIIISITQSTLFVTFKMFIGLWLLSLIVWLTIWQIYCIILFEMFNQWLNESNLQIFLLWLARPIFIKFSLHV